MQEETCILRYREINKKLTTLIVTILRPSLEKKTAKWWILACRLGSRAVYQSEITFLFWRESKQLELSIEITPRTWSNIALVVFLELVIEIFQWTDNARSHVFVKYLYERPRISRRGNGVMQNCSVLTKRVTRKVTRTSNRPVQCFWSDKNVQKTGPAAIFGKATVAYTVSLPYIQVSLISLASVYIIAHTPYIKPWTQTVSKGKQQPQEQ